MIIPIGAAKRFVPSKQEWTPAEPQWVPSQRQPQPTENTRRVRLPGGRWVRVPVTQRVGGVGSIGGISYINPDTYAGELPIDLAAEVNDNIDVQDVVDAITAAGGKVQTTDNIYGRNVVFFSIDDIDYLTEIENITGVYLVKEPYTTYPWSYTEEEQAVVTVPVVEDEEDGVAAFVRNNIKPILVISITAVVLYSMYGKGSK